MAFKLCCSCKSYTVGFWGDYEQIYWVVNFPSKWTKLFSRNASNLTACNVLVIGWYKFDPPYVAVPSSSGDYAAVASWITGGGTLLVLNEYYGSPTVFPVTPINTINTSLTGIGTQARAVATSGPAPTSATTPIGTYPVGGTGDVMAGVDKLWVAGPGFMSLGTSTLEFEARKTVSDPYVSIVSVESFGAGFVVFVSDFSMVNNASAASAITSSGNKIRVFLENLGKISTN
jgi:hypothetical protein